MQKVIILLLLLFYYSMITPVIVGSVGQGGKGKEKEGDFFHECEINNVKQP